MAKTTVTAIMAATADGVIGCTSGNGIPWDCPGELEHYRRTTAGAVIVMGRRTFDALPEHAFLNRSAVVLSRTFEGCARAIATRSPRESLSQAFAVANGRPIFVIGGAGAIASYLDDKLIDSFLLSRIHEPCKGDVRMDLSRLSSWREEVLRREADFTLCRLTPPY